MRVHIIGTGAMACLFGARLSRVSELTLGGTWPEGMTAIEEKGIVLESVEGVETRHVKTIRWGTGDPRADLLIVLVKSWQTERAAAGIPALVSPRGTVLTLQNGLGNVEKLGPGTVSGVTSAAATLVAPGRVRLVSPGETAIAGPPFIAGLFEASGLPARTVDAAEAMTLAWGKLVVNAGINAVTALLDIPNGELLSRPDARTLMERAATEAAAVAHAKGISLPFPDAAEEARRVARATASNLSSMLQDVRRGAPTEVEAINGAVVREAASSGVPVPVNESLWRLVAARVAA